MLYQVKTGLLGLGDLGSNYAKLLKSHIKDLNLIGAVGKTQKELLFAKNDLSLEYVYSDDHSLIENHDIDAICLFGDAQQRPHLAIKAIEAGKHLFIADPVSLNVEDAQAVHDVAARHPSQLVMVSSLVRFDSLMKTVKKVLDSGEIGIVNHISLDSAFFNGLNRRYNKSSGSAFLDSAIDEIDFCLWLLGGDKIVEVEVKKNKNTIICNGSTSKESSINIIVQPGLKKEQSYINIYGNKGQLIVSNTNKRSFKLYKDNGEKVDIYQDDTFGFQFSEYVQLHNFAQAILGRQKKKMNTADAVAIVELAVALEKASVFSKKIVI